MHENQVAGIGLAGLLLAVMITALYWFRPFQHFPIGPFLKRNFIPKITAATTTKFLLCLLTALIISSAEYYCAWRVYGPLPHFRAEQWRSWKAMGLIRDDLEKYKQDNKRFPSSLAEVYPELERENGSRTRDGWNRPFMYELGENGDYNLYSYGRDGLRGGGWDDSDIYSDQKHFDQNLPTLAEFSNASSTERLRLACVLTGAFAFPLFYSRRAVQSPCLPSLRRVIVAALSAIFVALIISALHIPSGH